MSDWVGNECGEVNFRSCGTKFGCVHCVVVLQVTANTPGVTRYQSKVRGGSVGVKIHGFFDHFRGHICQIGSSLTLTGALTRACTWF